MGPADQDPRPESADRETGALNRGAARQDNLADQADQRADQAGQRERAADQREARIDQLMRGSGVSTESVHRRAQEAITRSRQLIARSAAAMDRCEALLRRQVQRSSQEQSATDRETACSRRDAGP